MKSEWRATDDAWWPLEVVLSVAVPAVLILIAILLEHEAFWVVLALGFAGLLSVVGKARARLRFTDDGVEVRRLRSRVYRWSEIVSAERAPEWDNPSVIWLRRRGAVPTSAPDVLRPPGLRGRARTDETLDHIVAVIRRRAGLD